jgi:hypothetical protein
MSFSRNFSPSTKFSSSKENFCSFAATFPPFYLHNLFEVIFSYFNINFLLC